MAITPFSMIYGEQEFYFASVTAFANWLDFNPTNFHSRRRYHKFETLTETAEHFLNYRGVPTKLTPGVKIVAKGRVFEVPYGVGWVSSSNRVNHRGHFVYSDYTCLKCSCDEFVRAGVCSGVFTIRTSDFEAGRRCCRCSSSYRFTVEQRLWQTESRCKELNYVLVNWKGTDKSNAKNFQLTLECNNGHLWTTNPDKFLYKLCCCPECAGYAQQQCYINVVMDGNLPVAYKVGIARDSDTRIRTQNRNNLFHMSQVVVYNFPTVENCKAAERACLSELRCGVLSKRELKDGWTETVALTDYDKVVSIYERFGGVRVDTLTKEET